MDQRSRSAKTAERQQRHYGDVTSLVPSFAMHVDFS